MEKLMRRTAVEEYKTGRTTNNNLIGVYLNAVAVKIGARPAAYIDQQVPKNNCQALMQV